MKYEIEISENDLKNIKHASQLIFSGCNPSNHLIGIIVNCDFKQIIEQQEPIVEEKLFNIKLTKSQIEKITSLIYGENISCDSNYDYDDLEEIYNSLHSTIEEVKNEI